MNNIFNNQCINTNDIKKSINQYGEENNKAY